MHKDKMIDFFKNTNLMCVIDHGRAGNGFFQTIFDQHPEVITCPWVHYVYSYLITEFGEKEFYDSKLAHDFWTQKSYFRYLYNDLDDSTKKQIIKFGGNPEAKIDRKLVRKSFDEFVLSKNVISRKEIVMITYYSYALAIGRDASKVKYILVTDAISLRHETPQSGFSGKVINCITRDFDQAKLVHLIRDPRAGFASVKHQFVNTLGNMYGIQPGNYWGRFLRLVNLDFDRDSVFVFLFWLMCLCQTYKAIEHKKNQYPALFKTVKNEDLNLEFHNTTSDIADWLGIAALDNWDQNYVPTMIGFPWTGTGAYNSTYQPHTYGLLENDRNDVARTVTGPNAYVTERWKKKLYKNEILITEYIFKNEITKYGYHFIEYKPATSKLYLFFNICMPLNGELPSLSWIKKGMLLSYRETMNRIFYSLCFPPFYITGRIVFLYLIWKRNVFSV